MSCFIFYRLQSAEKGVWAKYYLAACQNTHLIRACRAIAAFSEQTSCVYSLNIINRLWHRPPNCRHAFLLSNSAKNMVGRPWELTHLFILSHNWTIAQSRADAGINFGADANSAAICAFGLFWRSDLMLLSREGEGGNFWGMYERIVPSYTPPTCCFWHPVIFGGCGDCKASTLKLKLPVLTTLKFGPNSAPWGGLQSKFTPRRSDAFSETRVNYCKWNNWQCACSTEIRWDLTLVLLNRSMPLIYNNIA